ncbi:MAG: lmo0937 family membrane protein [Candidatus Limnocylindria bacterium]
MIELIIVVLLLLWLFGYFGRGRMFARGPAMNTSGLMAGGSWVHLLLILVVILIVLRLLRLL